MKNYAYKKSGLTKIQNKFSPKLKDKLQYEIWKVKIFSKVKISI